MSTKAQALSAFWRRRSLKFWLATGMMMAVLPITVFSVTGYLVYHHQITRPLVDVASKQRGILLPLQGLQLDLIDISELVNDFAVGDNVHRIDTYRQKTAHVDGALAQVASVADTHGMDLTAINSARSEWKDLSQTAQAILSAPKRTKISAEVGIFEHFEAAVDAFAHTLGKLFDDIRVQSEADHNKALWALDSMRHMVVAAFGLSFLFIILGVKLINRSLVSSMNELASGAMRFAAGDREHDVEVLIPRELANVATAFNSMTRQIVEQEEALEEAARTDGLTGLFNRREFDRMLAEELVRGERYGTSVSLIMIDIDHFKRFNDTYGHQGGDDALCTVARVIKANVRDVDKVCRFGGEEIAIILPAIDAEGATQTAERVRAAVAAETIDTGGQTTAAVTISSGVASLSSGTGSPDTLLHAADAALYKSKETGRNRVTVAAF